MPVVYAAVTRFDPTLGEKWQSYINWSGLTQLREVISLDGLLCPSIFQELTDEDWSHNVHEDFKTDLFFDLDHVLKRVAGDERVNILALLENSTADEIASFADPRFLFRGFDVVDVHGDISALVNCGGFDKTFSNDELSEFGLITDFRRASAIRQSLPTDYPNEPHAECNMWAIWQMVR
jgi:hypothetical protein